MPLFEHISDRLRCMMPEADIFLVSQEKTKIEKGDYMISRPIEEWEESIFYDPSKNRCPFYDPQKREEFLAFKEQIEKWEKELFYSQPHKGGFIHDPQKKEELLFFEKRLRRRSRYNRIFVRSNSLDFSGRIDRFIDLEKLTKCLKLIVYGKVAVVENGTNSPADAVFVLAPCYSDEKKKHLESLEILEGPGFVKQNPINVVKPSRDEYCPLFDRSNESEQEICQTLEEKLNLNAGNKKTVDLNISGTVYRFEVNGSGIFYSGLISSEGKLRLKTSCISTGRMKFYGVNPSEKLPDSLASYLRTNFSEIMRN